MSFIFALLFSPAFAAHDFPRYEDCVALARENPADCETFDCQYVLQNSPQACEYTSRTNCIAIARRRPGDCLQGPGLRNCLAAARRIEQNCR